MIRAPDTFMIEHALRTAARSPCRSKRGVVIYSMRAREPRGEGYNGPPSDLTCPGRSLCEGTCGQRSVHAEVRALRDALRHGAVYGAGPYDLIHVELATHGGVVACVGPSCWQCSREVLDVGFVDGVWLYEATPEKWCPHVDMPRIDCSFCQGVDCIADHGKCHASDSGPCPHDVLDRHGAMPVVSARWRRYTPKEFHRVTLVNCQIRTVP